MRARLVLGFVFACGAVAAGCGGKECGEGTIAMGDRCVPESEVTCGAGTTLDMATGMCVPDETVTCGAGTTLDEATGMCEPDVTCATGTIAMGGECVPDGSVICTGNTVYDMTTGTCVVDEGACGEGTVLFMGACVPFDDSLIADVHAGGEPDDPIFFDGTVTVFTPPGAGETVTIDGCITPANFDGDTAGTVDFDLDFFNFSVSGPGLYNMRVDGLNGLSAAFAVLSPDPEFAGWLRIGLNLTSDGADRQIWLPREGQYYIAIFDSRSIALDTLQEQFAFARPVGSTDTCYFMSLEALPTPAPVALTGETRTGRIGNPQFFTTARTGVVQANLEAEGFTLLPAVVLTDGTDYQNGAGSPLAFSFSPVVTDGETLTVIVDHVFDYSLMPVEYTLRVFDLDRLPDDGVVNLPYVGPDDLSFLYFEAAAGDVLEMSWGNGGLPIGMGIFAPDLTLITQPPPGAAPSYTQLVQGGRYIIGVLNVAEGFSMETFPIAYTSRIITPAALTVGTAGTVTLDGAFGFARIDASAVEWPIFTLANLMGTGFTSAEVFVFDGDEPGLIGLPRVPAVAADVPALERATTATTLERIWGTAPGRILVAVRDVATANRDETLDLTVAEQMFDDITLAADTPVTRAAVVVPPGGFRYYLARAAAGSPVSLTATGTGGANPVIRVLDRLAAPVQTVDATGADGVEVASVTALGQGWVAFAVGAGAAGGTVDVELLAGAPPYTVSMGTRSFADVCATGTTVVNGDDVLSPVRMHTLGTFQYFGAGATRMRIDTNGWITMDGGYAGGSQWTGTIPAAAAPNAVIAPAWQDGISRVCVLENAAEIVVQWTGAPYMAAGTIEMQAILYADGRIDFVYGPNHDVPPLEGRHGLESATGDFAILPPLSMVAAGQSIRFTPN